MVKKQLDIFNVRKHIKDKGNCRSICDSITIGLSESIFSQNNTFRSMFFIHYDVLTECLENDPKMFHDIFVNQRRPVHLICMNTSNETRQTEYEKVQESLEKCKFYRLFNKDVHPKIVLEHIKKLSYRKAYE